MCGVTGASTHYTSTLYEDVKHKLALGGVGLMWTVVGEAIQDVTRNSALAMRRVPSHVPMCHTLTPTSPVLFKSPPHRNSGGPAKKRIVGLAWVGSRLCDMALIDLT